MNNRRNFFRVEHSIHKYQPLDVGMGPYVYYYTPVWNHWNIKPPYSNTECEEANRLLARSEPVENTYKKFGIDPFKLKRVSTLSNERRPGPFEDFSLREKMIHKMGNLTKNGIIHLYGFDSLTQLHKWFNIPYERWYLGNLAGFVISKYRCRSIDFLSGSAQCVYFPEPGEKLTLVEQYKLGDFTKI